MAVAYESVSTNTSINKDAVSVLKPSGLAVGDLMLAHVACSRSDAGSMAAHTSTGFTEVATDESNSGTATNRATALYKIATADDVSASSFTFTSSGGPNSSAVALYRFSGASSVTGAADDNPSTTATPTFTNTITPTFADSILVFMASCANAGGATFSGYAVTTDNPTWTERYDVQETGVASDGDTSIAGATGPRSQTTATGNSTVTISTSVTDSVGIIVAVYPNTNVTVSPAVVTATLTVQAPSVVGNANVSPTVVTTTLAVQAPTVTTSPPTWSNESKNSSTWVNQDKT